MRLIWQLVAVLAVALIGAQAVAVVQRNPWLTLVVGVAAAVLAMFVYRWVVSRTEHRPPTELAWPGAGPAIGHGALIGVALFAAVIVSIALFGGYQINGLGTVPGAIGMIGFMGLAAVTEELLFRGVLFRIVEQWVGTWIAVALTGLLFGLVHVVNPNISLWGAIAIGIEAGGMLAAAYVLTRSLWLPIGLHFGWNFAAGGIFSTEVSGSGTPQGLLDAATSGPVAIAGGESGPEASVFAVVFGLLTTVVFLWMAHRRGQVLPRRRAAGRSGERTPESIIHPAETKPAEQSDR